MSTISVPLNKEALAQLEHLVKEGVGSSRADVMRRALLKLAEDKAVETILHAQNDPTLHGDLRTLAKKLK